MAVWFRVSSIGSSRGSRGAAGGVAPAMFHEMNLLLNSFVQNLREEAPVNKSPNAKNRGALRKSIRGELQTNGSQWRIVFKANDYVKYVVNKTRPHEIRPKRPGGVLVFSWNGQVGLSASLPPISHAGLGGVAGPLGRRGGPSILRAPAARTELRAGKVFLQVVHHPGTEANDFVARAYDKTMRAGTPGFTKRIQEAIASDILSAMPAA